MDDLFLAYVLDYLITQGIQDIILSVGYKAHLIEEYFGDRYQEVSLTYAVELEPMGTGGGILQAAQSLEASSPFFVVNGDTLFTAKLSNMAELYASAAADMVIALKEMRQFDRYGVVTIDEVQRITAFHEKQYCEQGYINAGIYLLNRAILESRGMSGHFSFERDFMERQVEQLQFFGQALEGYFIDIGIPEDYERAQEDLK